MNILLLGLVLFLGAHSLRIVADDWRERRIAQFGILLWKAGYSLVSLAGLLMIINGYGAARGTSATVYAPPGGLQLLALVLMLPALILLVAAYVPQTRIKAMVAHPMLLSVKVWALAHLLANGRAVDLLLFGTFLLWAVFGYRAAKIRDRAAGTRYVAGPWLRDVLAIAVGALLWLWFVFGLHGWLTGVPLQPA
ncbi:MAG: NnrU family protein [Gammaproteobacteria bacterium]|nr:NnrU family protein [Gammaproteobacteria bacterium]